MKGALNYMKSPEYALAVRACLDNNPALLDAALSQTDPDDVEGTYMTTRRKAIQHNALAVLQSLLDRGVRLKNVTPAEAWGLGHAEPATLELLLAHGWDINTREEDSNAAEPLMWFMVSDIEMVKWCLEHGASVHPRGVEPIQANVITKAQRSCEQILEHVAASGSIATFELLRSKGAPLGWRCLHHAVFQATTGDPMREDAASAAKHKERMAMVVYLLDVVKLDVNAPDQPVGARTPGRVGGPPFCYIYGNGQPMRDARELTWLLLDHGADPTPALLMAQNKHQDD